MPTSRRLLLQTFITGACLCAGWAVISSLHWPLVGDASLIHYVVFLLGKGWAPYRDIKDINLPGSYFFDGLAMRLLGTGQVAWRVYDLLLLVAVAAAVVFIAGKPHRKAAVLAAALFVLLHLQDGIAQSGQRDLLIAALLAAAYAALFAVQRGRTCRLLLFGAYFAIGITLTIKPLFWPLALVLAWLSLEPVRRNGIGVGTQITLVLAGLTLPWCFAVLWLVKNHALASFTHIAHTLLPLHARLGHRSAGFLIVHALEPLLVPLAISICVAALHRRKPVLEGLQLSAGLLNAMAAYVVQGKGFPYQRYPVLLFSLLLINLVCVEAMEAASPASLLALGALAFECLFLAPHAAWLTHSFRSTTPMQTALAETLRKSDIPLDRQVQCLDTFGGCLSTLYTLRVQQSTGYLYDCYLFAPVPDPAVQEYRNGFMAALRQSRPQVVILTDQFCFGGTAGFSKVGNWPLLQNELATDYRLQTEWHSPVAQRWWARPEQPTAFRVYRLR